MFTTENGHSVNLKWNDPAVGLYGEKNQSDMVLKGLSQGQKCFYLFADFKPYDEQIGPIPTIPSSNGSLDKALSNAHT